MDVIKMSDIFFKLAVKMINRLETVDLSLRKSMVKLEGGLPDVGADIDNRVDRSAAIFNIPPILPAMDGGILNAHPGELFQGVINIVFNSVFHSLCIVSDKLIYKKVTSYS